MNDFGIEDSRFETFDQVSVSIDEVPLFGPHLPELEFRHRTHPHHHPHHPSILAVLAFYL